MKIKFIHVGCHKCGSSFLQEEVLPKIKNISPITFTKGHPIFGEIEYLIRCGELYYEPSKVKDGIYKKTEGLGDICISSEGLCGTDTAIFGTGHQIRYIPFRLKDLFGNTKILIIIRNQKTLLPSLYRDDVRYGYLFNFKQWFMWRHNTYGLNYFKYSYLIDHYYNVFGRENVKVVLFEELFKYDTIKNIVDEFKVDPSGIKDIDFSKKVNESYSDVSAFIGRFIINRFFGSKLTYGVTYARTPRLCIYNLFRHKISKKIDKISRGLGIELYKYDFEGYNKFLYQLYHDTNKEVSKMIGRPLKAYDYI